MFNSILWRGEYDIIQQIILKSNFYADLDTFGLPQIKQRSKISVSEKQFSNFCFMFKQIENTIRSQQKYGDYYLRNVPHNIDATATVTHVPYIPKWTFKTSNSDPDLHTHKLLTYCIHFQFFITRKMYYYWCSSRLQCFRSCSSISQKMHIFLVLWPNSSYHQYTPNLLLPVILSCLLRSFHNKYKRWKIRC